MPRINIDEKLFIDPRFNCLEEKHGKNAAIGVCVRLWFLAQKFYVPDKQPVPHSLLVMSGLPIDDLLAAEFMSREGDHYWVYGCEEHFAWLLRSYENSKKGVEARRNKQPIGQPIAKPIVVPIVQPTSSSSSSSSSSNINTKNIYIKGSDLWLLFSTQYETKKGKQPSASKSALKSASEIEEVLPKEEWQGVVEAYLADTNPFLYKQGYQIVWLLRNLDKYRRIAPTADPMIEYFTQLTKETWGDQA